MMDKILIVGATSAIAHATARHFAHDGAQFHLIARNAEQLQAVADDLRAHGAANVSTAVLDLNDTDAHQAALDTAVRELGGLDVLFIAHGALGDPIASAKDYAVALDVLQTNFLSAVSMLTVAGAYFEQQRRGIIAVISSVAGDRVRASNTVYGAAMAAKTGYLSGLRNRLSKRGVTVITIKPGQVSSPMTAHMKQGLTFAKPEQVGHDIYRAMKRGQTVVYTPGYWRYLMLIIRAIPEGIFKRLNL
jgi:short-subunit dehydrogenase